MKHILFVCTGNTCRSPMAEALLKINSAYEVKSAGVFASLGAPASTNAIEVLKEKGIELDHQSQPVTEELIQWSDIIFTMTENHKQALLQHFPTSSLKVHVWKEYTGEPGNPDISDPFGGSLEIYRATRDEMEASIRKLIQLLEK